MTTMHRALSRKHTHVHALNKMATSIIGQQSVFALRSLLRISPGSSAVLSASYCSRKNITPTAHSTPETVNYRRSERITKGLLRKKRNFLHYEKTDEHRNSPLQIGSERLVPETEVTAPRNYRFVMPEFMPRPDFEKRDRLFERLERMDMLRRRSVINIPEFYVGSIMAVTVVDSYAPNKKNRFMGICLDRGDHGLKHWFILRNNVDGLGVEVMYDLYAPTILSIDVLKLEKRLDDQLYYLRDAPPEYSTFPFNMDPVTMPKGASIPINTMKVPLKHSSEWHWRWELYNPPGVDFEMTPPLRHHEKRMKRVERSRLPSAKYDLMKMYRAKVPEEEEEQIMGEVYKEKKAIDTKLKIGKATLKKK